MLDLTTQIIAYESGELNDGESLQLFSELIMNGQAWTLNGHYGRTALALIQQGLLDAEGTIIVKL